jgi:hypothetical protein
MTGSAPSFSRRQIARLQGFPWYPVLLAPALPMLAVAGSPIPLETAIRVFVVAVGIGLVVTLVWVRILGRDRGGAVAAITVMALTEAGDVARVVLFVAAIGLFLVEAAWSARGTMRVHIPWTRVTAALNSVLIVFVALQTGRALVVNLQVSTPPIPASWSAAPGTSRPDVFLIVTDGHGRSDVQRERYGYDDAPFQQAMSGLGFTSAEHSFANHSVTRYSLPVLLNGRPLTELGQDPSQPANDQVAYDAVLASSGVTMFDEAGYETSVIASGYEHLPLRRVDHYIDVGPRNELEQALMRSTAVGLLVDELTDMYAAGGRQRVLGELDELVRVAREPSTRPQFVLAHVPAPHFPVVVTADCSLRPYDGYTGASLARSEHAGNEIAVQVMADQTRCTDRLLADTVRDLVAARPEAVVIVLSDHGVEERLDWWKPQDPAIHDRMANMFLARTPGKPGLFPADITLVNVLPILANAYLGTDLPLHPNDLFFGPTRASPDFEKYQGTAP